MSHKPQIKIVKRGRKAGAPSPPESRAAREKDARRAVAENVSSWVEEFHERRDTEAGRTFASLFTDRA
jgi:hypothetical protein